MFTNAFVYLSYYIWWVWVVFMETLLFLIIFRILFSFIINFFRLNVKYNSFNNKFKTYNQHNTLDRQAKEKLFDDIAHS